jgi:SAM-dependent methyltransferase
MAGGEGPDQETAGEALARLYDLDLAEDPGDADLYRALAQRTGGPIIELAAGTGRIAIPLAAEGHRVVGVDLDPAMLARARRHADAAIARGDLGSTASPIELVEGDLVDVALDGAGAFRLAILGLGSILLLARDRQRAAIGRMAELLAPGGLAVVEAWLPAPHELETYDGRVRLEWLRADPESGRTVAKLSAAWYDPASRVVTLTTIFDEADQGGAPRRWTRSEALWLLNPDELRSLAEAAGLEIEQVAGDLALGPLDGASERVVVVARRGG